MTTRTNRIFAGLSAALVAVLMFAPAASAQQLLAIRDARIVTVAGPVIEKGSIVIRNGVIADVGANVTVPADAKVIDGKGLTVYPGLFDALTNIGLTEVPGITESDDFSDLGDFTPQLLAFNGFRSVASYIGISRSSGVLHVVTAPSGGMVAGQGAVMALGGSTATDMELVRRGPMILDFPKLLSYEPMAYTRRQHPWADYNADYQAKTKALSDYFVAARQYMTAKEKAGSSGQQPKRDVGYEAMIPVLKGQQLVYIFVRSDQDIRKAVEFAKAQKLNYALVGADDAVRMVDFLKENNVRLILPPPFGKSIHEDDPLDTVCRAPALLHQGGVSFVFGTGVGSDNRTFRHEVGFGVGCGLPADVALRSITLGPAELLGVANKVGSIEKGKRADLVLTDGDIFEYGTHIKQTFVNGVETGVATRYTELYDKFKDRK